MQYIAHTHDFPATFLIETMATFVREGTLDHEFAIAEKEVGALNLRKVCISLLSWLKSRSTFPKMATLQVNKAGSSKSALLKLLAGRSLFREVFEISEEAVHLRDTLSDLDIEKAIAAAARLYDPPRFVTRRHL